MTTKEVKEMALLIAEQEKKISSLEYNLDKVKNELDYATEAKNKYCRETVTLKEQAKKIGGEDVVKALMEAQEMLRRENADLHKRCDQAFAGVAIDASGRRNLLRSIVERLDGIKASVEALEK